MSNEIYCVKLPFGEGPHPAEVPGELFRFPLNEEGKHVWCFHRRWYFLTFYAINGGEVVDWEDVKHIYWRLKGAH